MRIYACTVHVYPCPKTSIDWSSRSQAFVPAAGPAGRASTARAKLAAQKQVSYGSNAWIGGSFFGWHIHIQLGRHITCNDFRGWNLEDHFSIQWYLIWTLGHNCVRLRLLWADFVWLRNFGAGVMMISMLPTATEIFSGPFAPRKLTKRALKKGLILGYPINIVDFSILDIKNCQKKETKNHKRQAFYDYLANDWAISTGEMPWASSGFAFADFLPASALEAVMFGRPNFCSNFVWVKIGENRWKSIQFLLDFLLEVKDGEGWSWNWNQLILGPWPGGGSDSSPRREGRADPIGTGSGFRTSPYFWVLNRDWGFESPDFWGFEWNPHNFFRVARPSAFFFFTSHDPTWPFWGVGPIPQNGINPSAVPIAICCFLLRKNCRCRGFPMIYPLDLHS